MTTSCSLVDLDCLRTSRVATAMRAHIKLWNAAHYVQLYGDAKKCSAGNEYAQHGKLLTPLHTPARSMLLLLLTSDGCSLYHASNQEQLTSVAPRVGAKSLD